ncbi:hypothetical protein HBA54_00385 [Pelagibius litoralis]|uniref:Flagellar FliL protein n=1 Tax=Pelagibius litoralis TaxID=374515 RepID=A0A967C2F5_9PROT|nr:hypothetical protein [Pelagibius litoralis]NIA67044.1 hypothetical protein [Pelagibius litoralis]
MRIVILIVVAVILLVGAGGGAWWFLMGPGAEKTEELISEINKPEPVFVPLHPVVISLIQEGEVTHHVTMQLTLQLHDTWDKDLTDRNMARLRDAFLHEMHGLYAMRMVREAGFESPLVKKRLIEICDRLLGEGVVAEILLRELERRQPNKA